MKHTDWMSLAETERERTLSLLALLDPVDWKKPTDCPAWDVRELVAHLVGMAEMQASVRENVRIMRLGKRAARGRPTIDGVTEVQVRERTDVMPEELLQDLSDATARALVARRRTPAPLRAIPIPFGPPLGTKPLGYLVDRIYTRDAWMHRIDIARATDRSIELTSGHDGKIVADVMAEWAGVHGQPYDAALTGPAGGRFRRESGGEEIRMDAVEFARLLAGRGTGAGLLATTVPF